MTIDDHRRPLFLLSKLNDMQLCIGFLIFQIWIRLVYCYLTFWVFFFSFAVRSSMTSKPQPSKSLWERTRKPTNPNDLLYGEACKDFFFFFLRWHICDQEVMDLNPYISHRRPKHVIWFFLKCHSNMWFVGFAFDNFLVDKTHIVTIIKYYNATQKNVVGR